MGRSPFRCCRGEVSDARYPVEEERPTYERAALSNERAREILRGIPELEAYAEDFRLFVASDVEKALTAGDRSLDSLQGFRTLDAQVVKWAPAHGVEAWAFAGIGNGEALIAVVHPNPDGGFTHGSSFILEGPARPHRHLLLPRHPSRDELDQLLRLPRRRGGPLNTAPMGVSW